MKDRITITILSVMDLLAHSIAEENKFGGPKHLEVVQSLALFTLVCHFDLLRAGSYLPGNHSHRYQAYLRSTIYSWRAMVSL